MAAPKLSREQALQGDNDCLRRALERCQRELDATSRELERWKRGQLVEGDYITANGDVVSDPWTENERLRDAIVERNLLIESLLAAGYPGQCGWCQEHIIDGERRHQPRCWYATLQSRAKALLTTPQEATK